MFDGLAVDHLLEDVLRVTATTITARKKQENRRLNQINNKTSSTAASCLYFLFGKCCRTTATAVATKVQPISIESGRAGGPGQLFLLRHCLISIRCREKKRQRWPAFLFISFYYLNELGGVATALRPVDDHVVFSWQTQSEVAVMS